MCCLVACGADAGVQSTPGDETGTTSPGADGGAQPEPSGDESTGEAGEDDEPADDTGQPPPVDPSYGDEARAALSDALGFYRTLNHHGGWVWTYAEDLSRSWGEGETTADQLWVQPPGTPAIGMVYLRAYWATGDDAYLEAATEAAVALRYGQLESGGWTNAVDFDPQGEWAAQYRNGMSSGKNNSSLDDDITQAALRFLIALDAEIGDPTNAEAVTYGLDALLDAQFASGAFPAIWDDAGVFDLPVLPATISLPYPTVPNGGDYWDYPTLNDNLGGNVAKTLATAYAVYDDTRFRDSLIALGEFLLLAQLPSPQTGWAQQYNAQMEPGWARVFEPPAVTGSESQDVMETLLMVYELSGDSRYTDAVATGLEYFQGNLLPNGQLSRFYELGTDMPLYFTSDYDLTYDDSDLPGHYGFKIESRLDEIEQEHTRVLAGAPPPQPDAAALEARALEVIDALDDQGRWVDYDVKIASGIPQGDYIRSVTFVDNCEVLLDYLNAPELP